MRKQNTALPAQSWLVLAMAGLLTACGGGSASDNATTDDHDHAHSGRLLYSLTDNTTLKVYDQAETSFENLESDAAGNAAQLVLADNGLSAAVYSPTEETVQIVYSGLHAEEETATTEAEHGEHAHTEMLSISLDSVDQVVVTRGHFSALLNGYTRLLPTADVETTSLDFEAPLNTPASQTYPALVLEEAHDLKLFFTATTAYIYEDGTEDSFFACTTPSGHAEAGELTVLNCGNGAHFVLAEEHDGHHHLHNGAVEFDAATTVSGLTSNGHDIIAWNSTGAWALAAEEHSHVDAVSIATAEPEIAVHAEALTLDLNGAAICTAAFATEDEDTLGVLTNNNQLHLIDLAGTSTITITLDESSTTGCDHVRLATGPEAFMVADRDAGLVYLVDSHDGRPYHIHSRLRDDSIRTLENMVFMHAVDASHDHDHVH